MRIAVGHQGRLIAAIGIQQVPLGEPAARDNAIAHPVQSQSHGLAGRDLPGVRALPVSHPDIARDRAAERNSDLRARSAPDSESR